VADYRLRRLALFFFFSPREKETTSPVRSQSAQTGRYFSRLLIAVRDYDICRASAYARRSSVRSTGSRMSPWRWNGNRACRCLVSTSATQTSLISRPTICRPRRHPAAVRTTNAPRVAASRRPVVLVVVVDLRLSPRSIKGAISRDKNPRLVSFCLFSSLLFSFHPVVSRVVSARADVAIEIVTDDVCKTI